QNNAVPTCSTNHGQCDTGVTGSTFYDGATWAELAGLFGSINDGYPNAVFDRVGRVVELNLDGHVSRQTFCEAVETNQGSLTNCLSDVIEHLCHRGIILYGVQALKTVLAFNNRR